MSDDKDIVMTPQESCLSLVEQVRHWLSGNPHAWDHYAYNLYWYETEGTPEAWAALSQEGRDAWVARAKAAMAAWFDLERGL